MLLDRSELERPWRGDPASIVVASEPDPLELLRRLADLVPAWHRDAACAGEPVGVFFPGLGEPTQHAYEFCGRCPVRRACLDWALDEQINQECSAECRRPLVVLTLEHEGRRADAADAATMSDARVRNADEGRPLPELPARRRPSTRKLDPARTRFAPPSPTC